MTPDPEQMAQNIVDELCANVDKPDVKIIAAALREYGEARALKVLHKSDDWWFEVQKKTAEQARRSALEEAAKVADECDVMGDDYMCKCAKRIRAILPPEEVGK
jgi:hypothetical protein